MLQHISCCNQHMLFRGTATEGRLSKWLKGIMTSNGASMISLGIIAFDIGTHSFRKGVATFVGRCIAGLSAISIFLPAGWSLGVVTSRHIFTGQGGDHVICVEYCLLLFDLYYVLQHPIHIFDASRAIFNVTILDLAKQSYNIDAYTIIGQGRLGDITYLTF